MTKVYIIVDCCSGEDYSTDDPTVLFVTTDEAKAKDFFCDEIENWKDGMTNYDDREHFYADGTVVYECTDFENDSHRVMKLVEKVVD